MSWFLQKINRKVKNPSGDSQIALPRDSQAPTVPIKEGKTSEEVQKKLDAQPAQLIAVIGHSVGQQRDNNEDALFTLTTSLVSDTRNIPFGLYIVADGMGGHQHGEVASGVAIRVMAGYVTRKLYLPIFNIPGSPPSQSLQEVMLEGIQEAHRYILQERIGGGTTLTAALVVGEKVTVAHAGDSRAYTIGIDGDVRVLTRDHSLVKRLEELGQLSPEESAVHPQRNVLYRALGQGEVFEPDITTSNLPCPGFLLLCSDGLWGVLEQSEIIKLVTSSPSPYLACQKLVEAANSAGGPDNISAILVQIPEMIY